MMIKKKGRERNRSNRISCGERRKRWRKRWGWREEGKKKKSSSSSSQFLLLNHLLILLDSSVDCVFQFHHHFDPSDLCTLQQIPFHPLFIFRTFLLFLSIFPIFLLVYFFLFLSLLFRIFSWWFFLLIVIVMMIPFRISCGNDTFFPFLFTSMSEQWRRNWEERRKKYKGRKERRNWEEREIVRVKVSKILMIILLLLHISFFFFLTFFFSFLFSFHFFLSVIFCSTFFFLSTLLSFSSIG